MKRALAGLLLLAFGFGLIAPLVSAEPDSKLPACCRRDGKHGCAMLREKAATGAGFRNGAGKCPLYPAGKPAQASARFLLTAPVSCVAAPALSRLLPVEYGAARPRVFWSRAHQKRGPPPSTT